MRTDLLIIGRDALTERSFDFKRFFMLLSDKGYDIENIYSADDEAEISGTIKRISSSSVIVIGDTDKIFSAVSNIDADEENPQYFKSGDNTYILLPEYDEQYIKDILIPVLNSKSKTFFNTVIFKVFGKTEYEIKELLKDQIHNRNKITFNFYPSILECGVHVRYSSYTSSAVINEIVGAVGELLRPYSYAYSDVSLEEQTVKQLIASNKRISIVETFTKGGLTKELSKSREIDALMLESIIVGSEKGIRSRLGVDKKTIADYGAVSDEAAYVITGNMFANPDCDIALTVLGDISSVPADGGDCVFYIAIGDRNAIHVFAQHYFGSRTEIAQAGVKHAVCTLYKFLVEEKNTK